MAIAAGFLDSIAIFQSAQSLVGAFRGASSACEDFMDLRTELMALHEALHVVGDDENGRTLGLQAHWYRNEAGQVDEVAGTLGKVDARALALLQQGFLGSGGRFGISEEAPERAARALGEGEVHGQPITSIFTLQFHRERTGAMGADGFPEKINMYFVPIGTEGSLGTEPLSFLIRDDRFFLHQVNGGRCLWMGAINVYQATADEPLTCVELLEAYRVMMEQVGRPLQRGYNPMEFVRLYNRFGVEASLVRGEGAADEVSEALDAGQGVLVFADGGTRAILGKTADGKVKWFNFFQGRLEEIAWEEFVRRLGRYHHVIVDPQVIGRMIGHVV